MYIEYHYNNHIIAIVCKKVKQCVIHVYILPYLVKTVLFYVTIVTVSLSGKII